MTPQLTHPGSKTLLGELDSFFRSKRIFTRQDRRLVFLCGGPVSSRNASFRRKLLDYARTSLPEFRFFLAEDAARDLFGHGNPIFTNIAEFEVLLSNLADCVLIIPESAGSIAELGYFSAKKKVLEKLLVVTDLGFQGDESFLSLGPIELVSRRSRYRPVIQVKLKARRPTFRPIVNTLRRHEPAIRGHFEFKNFHQLPIQHQFFVIFELIYLFDKISYDAIEYLIQSTFCDRKQLSTKQKHDLRQLLSILCAGHYVKRIGNDALLTPAPQAIPFFDIDDFERNSLKINISDFVRRTQTQKTPRRHRRSK